MTAAVVAAKGSVPAVGVVFALAGMTSAASLTRTPTIRDQVGATPQLLSLALVCVGIGSIVSMPWTGRLSDRFSTAWVVRAFAALATLAWTLIALAPSVATLAPAMFLAGAGFGVWDVAMNVQGSLVEQAQRKVHMPLLHALFSFGAVAGALLGAGFARLEVPIVVQYPLVWGVALVAVFIATTRFIDDRVSAPDPTVPAGSTEAPENPPKRRINRVEILIGLMMACTALGEGAANDWLGLMLVDDRGVAEAFGALVLGGFNLTMAVARIVGGRMIARFGRVPVLRVSGATAAVGVLLVCLVNSPVTALIGAGLWGLGLAVVFPSGISAAGDLGGNGSRSIARVSTVGYGGFLLGAPLIGQLTHFMRLDQALLVVAVAGGVVVLLAGVTREQGPAGGGGSPRLDGGAAEEIIRSG